MLSPTADNGGTAAVEKMLLTLDVTNTNSADNDNKGVVPSLCGLPKVPDIDVAAESTPSTPPNAIAALKFHQEHHLCPPREGDN
jgi:hypothetical protein